MRTSSRLAWLLIASTMVSAILLGSCSTRPSEGPAQPAPTAPKETKPEGSLTLAVNFYIGALVESSGEIVRLGTTFQALWAGVFDSLMYQDPDGKVMPGIAERWEIAPDGLSHTFYIRKGVKFHDGSDLTGEDVKFTIESVLDPKTTGGDPSLWRATVKSVELKDDYTVVLQMKEPQFEMLKGFEGMSGAPSVLPKKYIKEKGWDYFVKNPIGSGTWKIVKFVQNTSLELEAVENHWRGVPKFKNMTLLNVKEEGTKVAMLKTGELDIAEISPDSAPQLKTSGLRTYGHYGASQWYFALFYDLENPDKWAFGNIKVREAMSLAVDRKEVADKLYGGLAQPAAVYGVPLTAYFFDPKVLKPYIFDPEQGKKRMAEAGYANGFSTTLWDTGGGAVLSTFNLALAGYWRKIGIDVKVEPGDYSTVQAKWLRKARAPEAWNYVWTASTAGGYANFEKMFTSFHSEGSFRNLKNARLDELIMKVSRMASSPEKTRLALEAAELGRNEYNIVAVVDIDTIFALSAKVGDFKPTKGMMNLADSLERITHAK